MPTRHGEDAIYLDAAKSRYVGAVSLGLGPDGKRIRLESGNHGSGRAGRGMVLRELRHAFVSLMWPDGVPIEQIVRLAGHHQTSATELVYRHESRSVFTTGAEVMDQILAREVPSVPDLGRAGGGRQPALFR